MSATVYLSIPIMLVLAVVQSVVLPRFPLFGIVPQLFLLATIAWALRHGLQQGIVWAFVAGLLIDLFSAGPLGTTTLALIVATALVATIRRSFPEGNVLLPALLSMLATMVFWSLYLLTLRLAVPPIAGNSEVLGIADLVDSVRAPGLLRDIAAEYGLNRQNFQLVVPTALVHGVLILPIYWLFLYLDRWLNPRRVEV